MKERKIMLYILDHYYLDMFIGSRLKNKFYYLLIFLLSAIFTAIDYLSVVPSSSSSSSSEARIRIYHSNDIFFKQRLFNERLSSYNLLYNDSLPVCNNTNLLTANQTYDFHKMSELLQIFRKQIVPYPNDHFYGRGIVLTAGPSQMNFAKVNLKMIELSGTKLSVQVRLIYSVFSLG